MPTYHSFEQLDCYQKCRKLRIWINQFLKRHDIRDRDLVDNLKRAGRSTTRNVAEGFGRKHIKETIQFARISRGSVHEILDDLNSAVDEGYCQADDIIEGRILAFQALKSLGGYVNYLKRSHQR